MSDDDSPDPALSRDQLASAVGGGAAKEIFKGTGRKAELLNGLARAWRGLGLNEAQGVVPAKLMRAAQKDADALLRDAKRLLKLKD